MSRRPVDRVGRRRLHPAHLTGLLDPAEQPGIVTTMMIFYALHAALVKPMPGTPRGRRPKAQ